MFIFKVPTIFEDENFAEGAAKFADFFVIDLLNKYLIRRNM